MAEAEAALLLLLAAEVVAAVLTPAALAAARRCLKASDIAGWWCGAAGECLVALTTPRQWSRAPCVKRWVT